MTLKKAQPIELSTPTGFTSDKVSSRLVLLVNLTVVSLKLEFMVILKKRLSLLACLLSLETKGCLSSVLLRCTESHVTKFQDSDRQPITVILRSRLLLALTGFNGIPSPLHLLPCKKHTLITELLMPMTKLLVS